MNNSHSKPLLRPRKHHLPQQQRLPRLQRHLLPQ